MKSFDIKRGERMLKSRLTFNDFEPYIERITPKLNSLIPSKGKRSTIKLNDRQIDELLKNGVKWMVKHGYGTEDDLKHIESGACLVKNKMRDRIGTLGAGQFFQVCRIDEIFNKDAAKDFGLFKDQIVIMINTGAGDCFENVNRQMITHETRQAWEDTFGTGGGHLDIVYDVAGLELAEKTHMAYNEIVRLQPIIVIRG